MTEEDLAGVERLSPGPMEDRKRLAYLTWAVAALAAGALLAYGVLSASGLLGGFAFGSGGGGNAPEFSLSLFGDFEGAGEFDLAAMRGRPVIVNFWASWCGPCRAEMPAVERVWQRYRDRGLVIIGVTMQDREADARAFLEEVGVTYPVGLDANGSISRAYSVQGLPSTYFINENGGVARAWVGAISEERLESLAVDLLR